MKQVYSNEQLEAMVRPLMDVMEKRVTAEEMVTIRRAYELANEAHREQWRKSGEPTVERYCECHPLPGDEVIGFKHDDGTIEIRKHLLCELIDCITNQLHLSIDSLHTTTRDCIVDCDINFDIHSYYELETVIASLNAIENVDEVWQQEVKPWYEPW